MHAFINVWQKPSVNHKAKVREFWLREKVVAEDQIRLRSEQLVCLMTDEQDEIVGVTTAYEEQVDFLRHKMVMFRQYIAPGARNAWVPYELARESIDILEGYYNDAKDGPLGIMTIIENDRMLKKNYAVWPRINLVYVGSTARGQHIRVRYFKHATLAHEH